MKEQLRSLEILEHILITGLTLITFVELAPQETYSVNIQEL